MNHVQQKSGREPKFSNANKGFTLIEIMVVVVIIGMMVALLTVNLARDLDRLARIETSRFLAIVNEVRDEAIITGESYLLYVDDSDRSFYFESTRTNKSGSVADELFKRRRLEKGLKLDWEVFDDIESEDEEESNRTRVIITSLGEITPFDVRITGEDLEYHVFINDENQLEQRNEKAN